MTQPAKHLKPVPSAGSTVTELEAQKLDACVADADEGLAWLDGWVQRATLFGEDRRAAEGRRFAAVVRDARVEYSDRAVKFRAAGGRA